MARPSSAKINVNKILKEHLYHGKTAKYLDIVLFEKSTPDEHGNTHVIYQSVSKEAREAGIKGPILGDAKMVDGSGSSKAPRRYTREELPQRPKPPAATGEDDGLDF